MTCLSFFSDWLSFQHSFFSKIHRFYCLSVFFSKTLHLCSSSFFQRLFVFMTCLSFFSKTHHLFNTSFFQRFIVSIACLSFFQRLSIFAAVLFFKGSLFLWPVCLFSQRLTIFSTLLFFKDSFLITCLFFKGFFWQHTDRATLVEPAIAKCWFCAVLLCLPVDAKAYLFFKGSPSIISLFLKEHLSFSQRLTFGPIFFAKISLPSPTPPHLLLGGGEACIHIFQQASQWSSGILFQMKLNDTSGISFLRNPPPASNCGFWGCNKGCLSPGDTAYDVWELCGIGPWPLFVPTHWVFCNFQKKSLTKHIPFWCCL